MQGKPTKSSKPFTKPHLLNMVKVAPLCFATCDLRMQELILPQFSEYTKY